MRIRLRSNHDVIAEVRENPSSKWPWRVKDEVRGIQTLYDRDLWEPLPDEPEFWRDVTAECFVDVYYDIRHECGEKGSALVQHTDDYRVRKVVSDGRTVFIVEKRA